jgi:GAF domain-containing protein
MSDHDRPDVHSERPPPEELSTVLREVAEQLYVSDDLDKALFRLTSLATEMIPGCDVASVSLVDDGRLRTTAATEEVAHRLDELQYETQEGPCLGAATGDRWLCTPSLADDARWPRFSRAVAEEFGMGSLLSCQLSRVQAPEHRTGAVNLYSRRPDAFTEADGMIGLLIGAHAGVLVDAARERADLRRALESRDVIGQAKGILMAQHGLDEDEAFAQLTEVSQRFNVKLRDLARFVTDAAADGKLALDPQAAEAD